MELFAEVFREGGKKNSLGRANEVVDAVLAEPSRLDELFDCIYDDDAWVRMRAIDSFEKVVKVRPSLAEPYVERIFSDLSKSEQSSVQWHVAQLFTEIELSDEQKTVAIEWLKNKLKNTDVDWIVSGDCMKALVYFYKKGLVDAGELVSLFTTQEYHHSKAIRKKATQLKMEVAAWQQNKKQ